MSHKDWRAMLDLKLNTQTGELPSASEISYQAPQHFETVYRPSELRESFFETANQSTLLYSASDESHTISVSQIIDYALSVRGSDIHLISGSKPAIRAGKLLSDMPETEVLTPEIINNLTMNLLNEKQRRELNECGEVDLSTFIPGKTALRINAFKQQGNVSLALRMISDQIPDFDSLNLPPVISQFANIHKGLVLVTGATGSGKSTTLAALIDKINETEKKHIITIEDPIEYIHNHKQCKINQRQVGADTTSFSSALRACLREDPDIILVGEMRDPETISIALTAAETGHLVFSTLHTVGAAKTIDRIIDAFPAEKQNQVRSQLATVLKGVVSQELMPRIGGGVAVACEIMVTTAAVKNLIREGKPHQIDSIIQTSQSQGMMSLDMSLADLVKKELVTKDIALERAQDESFLLNLIGRK